MWVDWANWPDLVVIFVLAAMLVSAGMCYFNISKRLVTQYRDVAGVKGGLVAFLAVFGFFGTMVFLLSSTTVAIILLMATVSLFLGK